MPTISDQNLMSLALLEARRTKVADVRPNPRVGAALISKNGQIISSHHKKSGGPHAEIEVLNLCKEQRIDTKDSVIAVTLEPCSHFGKTPPCADALIAAGIKKVIMAVEDPNPKVSGSGAKRLRENGIEVVMGVGADQAFDLNYEWLIAHKRSWPFVRIKMATSLDGLMSSENGESQWITGPVARAKGHELRARTELIITGSGTIKSDNPRLSARDKNGNELLLQPKLWVLSRDKDFDVTQFVISKQPSFGGVFALESLKEILQQAYEQQISEVLLEAGPRLTHAFLAAGLFDEIHLFYGACLLGGKGQRLDALSEGRLPGLELEIVDSKILDKSNQYLILKNTI